MNPKTTAARTLSDRELPEPSVASAPSALHLISERSLVHLSDQDLLARTRGLVGRSNQLFATLLAHLAEVEARGLHRVRACSSLYTYCIYELRFSEDAAFRRVSAARLVKRFPAVLDSIERGELHLTGLLMLGPHLTQENHREVLARAKHRTKKEIAKLVRVLDPLPDVPARIEPLGPAPARSALGNPSWEQFAHSTNTVRELNPGERPRDWMDGEGALDAEQDTAASVPASRARITAGSVTAPARVAAGSVAANDLDDVSPDSASAPARVATSDLDVAKPVPQGSASAPARAVPPLIGPQRYQVQFTATEEYVGLVEQAKALLSHAAPHVELAVLHLRAMRTLVAELSKRRYAAKAAAPANPEPLCAKADKRGRAHHADHDAANDADHGANDADHAANDADHAANDADHDAANDADHGANDADHAANDADHAANDAHHVTVNGGGKSPRGRAIPAAVKRAVFVRDEGRCSYVEPRSGERCRETHHVEFHHQTAFAHGGPHTASNISLRCAAHNLLAAEGDFGHALVAERKDSSRHESSERQCKLS